MGEFTAFLIGWTLILEYVIGSASVVRGLSTYVDALFNNTMRNAFETAAHIDIDHLSSYPDFFAFGVTLIFSGMRLSSKLNLSYVKQRKIFNIIHLFFNFIRISLIKIFIVPDSCIGIWCKGVFGSE